MYIYFKKKFHLFYDQIMGIDGMLPLCYEYFYYSMNIQNIV